MPGINNNGNGKVVVWLATLIFGIGQVVIAFSLKEIYRLNAAVQTMQHAMGVQVQTQERLEDRLREYPPRWLTDDVKKNTERIEDLESGP